MRPLLQFDSVVFLAGGVGSTFTVPLMRDLVRSWIESREQDKPRGWFNMTSAPVTRHIRFVWVVKSRDHLAWFARELSEAAENVSSLRSEGLDVELHASLYITCDDVLDLTEKHRPQPTGRAVPKEVAALTISEKTQTTKKDSINVESRAVKSPDSSTSSVKSLGDGGLHVKGEVGVKSPAEVKGAGTAGQAKNIAKGCGSNGACCCTTTIEDEEAADAITQCTCNCDDASSVSESSSAMADDPSQDSLNSETESLEQPTKGGEWLHSAISVFSGRPHPRTLIRKSLEQAGGESAVVVCGPAGLVDDVRASVVGLSDERAVHKGTGAQGIYLHTEEFCY